MRSVPLLVFAAILLLPFSAGAQSIGGLGNMSGDAFTLSISPQYPSPYGQATISLVSNTLNLANSILTVSVNGKETYKGAAHTFPVSLGRGGSVAKVKVTISSGGASYNQTLSIQPQDVVLVAEPIASVPPLYPGKPFVPLEGNVRVVAMANLADANGKVSNPTTYSYAWMVDGVQMADSSGIGKSSIIIASPLQYRAREVSVAVTNSNESFAGGTSFSLSAMEPSVRMYENDPLLGIRFDHALSDSYTIDGTEATLYAAPFSLPTTAGIPFVQWLLGGSVAQTGNSITLRPTGNGKGSASLSLVASAGESVSVTSALSLIFGIPSSTNLFGL